MREVKIYGKRYQTEYRHHNEVLRFIADFHCGRHHASNMERSPVERVTVFKKEYLADLVTMV